MYYIDVRLPWAAYHYMYENIRVMNKLQFEEVDAITGTGG